jgi:diacylglycerol kinase family enzyme
VRVIVAHNPRSGSGRAAAIASGVARALRAHGAETVGVPVGPGAGTAELLRALAGADAAFVAGGDGTVHHLAPVLMQSGTPVYHLPAGNENLFAREFGMSAQAAAAVGALSVGRHARMDTGEYSLEGRTGHFLLMAGFGPDASVIHRLAAARTRAIGHRAYVVPVLKEVARPRFPRLTVRADGDEIVRAEPGMLIVANSRHYGLRIDPAHRASVLDGLLDVVFLPCASPARAVWWLLRSRLRRHERGPGLVYRRAAAVTVEASEPAPFQVDGECPHGEHAGLLRGPISIRVRPGSLSVLAPAK